MNERKSDHIRVALQSQVTVDEQDKRFHYEPLLSAHPGDHLPETSFLGKKLKVPVWISSMTGGTEGAYEINMNLARACNEFGMGMGLGSCRSLLFDNTHLHDFAMRDIIGNDLPFYANLGIVQLEQLVHGKSYSVIHELVKNRLKADGLIIHVNPLQEWFQPEGDRLEYAALDTIAEFLNHADYPVIVKEVGQGMGPKSLKALMQLPLAAVEFASFGGTNFARAELLRGSNDRRFLYEPYTRIGETAVDMVDYINEIIRSTPSVQCREIIVSGGIHNFLDGFYLINKINATAVYGQASAFLQQARTSYEALRQYCIDQINGLKLAYAFLSVK